MKKIFTLLMCTAVLTFVSCEDEPLEGDFLTGGTTCEEAILNTTQAALSFLGVNDDNYTQLCTAYRNALEAQIQACGDEDGTLQAAVTALGDCSNNVANDCDTATEAVEVAQAAFADATADNYTILCNAYKTTLENQILQCGDDDGSIQSTIDDLGDCVFVNTPLYEIGDIGPAGGFVFYVAPNGGGMEVAPISTQFQTQWGCYSTDINGTQSAFGTGINNSELILQYHMDIDFYNNPEQCQAVDPISGILVQSTGDVAAKHCDDFVFNGFNDWYLPSVDELHLAYTNLFAAGLGDFDTVFLASSTQEPEDHWKFLIVDFDDNGAIWGDPKSDLVYYRAIRSF
ncbi:MAG: hypothetical protein V7719_13815 [Psychroserpens sp.]|uniref:hypothetical protein n=1 Tax=Psychroserpens sp. TaxID=2020870 RepID=UPI0030029D4D